MWCNVGCVTLWSWIASRWPCGYAMLVKPWCTGLGNCRRIDVLACVVVVYMRVLVPSWWTCCSFGCWRLESNIVGLRVVSVYSRFILYFQPSFHRQKKKPLLYCLQNTISFASFWMRSSSSRSSLSWQLREPLALLRGWWELREAKRVICNVSFLYTLFVSPFLN